MSSTQSNNNTCLQGEVLRMGTHKKLKVKWSRNGQGLTVSAVWSSHIPTMKKRFFVIRGETETSCGCLEYYESERKYKLHQPPKKIIRLKYCFNINKRNDLKIKNVLSLYTKSDCLSIIFEKEEVCNDWLKTLLALQYGSDFTDGQELQPQFAHVWHVNMQKRELGNSRNILGPHLLCLTDRTLSLIKITGDDEPSSENLDFPLSSIRRCGDFSSFLYVEVGQMSVTGPGNLWMEAEDEVIAKNMHHAILNVCANSSSRKPDVHPKGRIRSFSINEASKPIEVSRSSNGDNRSHYKAQTANDGGSFATSPVSVSEPMGFLKQHAHCVGGENVVVHHQRTLSDPLSPLPSLNARRASTGNGPNLKRTSASTLNNNSNMRERCDSMPSRARSNTETSQSQGGSRAHMNRPHTVYTRGLSYSPPVASSPVSPQSGGCSTDSAGSSLSIDGDGEPWGGDDSTANESSLVSGVGTGRYCHSITPDEPAIMEENSDDYGQWNGEDAKLNNYMPMNRSTTGHFSLQIQPASNLSNASYRKYPHSNSSFKSHSPSQGSFSDSLIANATSPAEQSAYTPMSPGESQDTIDSYVPMAPTFGDDGYVNMNSNPNKKRGGSHSLAGSTTSITSGTPSTDLRFSEYHLDKVKSYFSPMEDDHEEQRPTRAYSIGSRPEKFKNKNARMEHVEKSDNSRVRAFSVGSRPNIRPNIPKKPPAFVSSSLSSMEQSDDLMEIDFSQNNKKNKKKKSYEHLIVPSVMSSSASSYSTAEGSLMDISPRCSPKLGISCAMKTGSPDLAPSPPRASFTKNYIGRSPPKSAHHSHSLLDHHLPRLSPPGHSYYISPTLHKVSEAPVGYVDMCPGAGGELLLAASPPRHASNLTQGDSNTSSYVDMKPGAEQPRVSKKELNPRPQNFPTIKPALLSTIGKVPHVTKWDTKPDAPADESKVNDYMEMDMKKNPTAEDNNNKNAGLSVVLTDTGDAKQASQGYVEMNWNASSKVSSEKLSSSIENQDYINMNLGQERKKDTKTRKTLNKGRYSSQPISIKGSSANDSVTSPVSVISRKLSTGASPKIPSFLPVGFRASMTRWDSKESSSSSSGVNTPTNSNSTMFPLILSCPTSPSQENYEMCPKIPVDATSGTVKISYPTNASIAAANSNASKSLESVQEVENTSDYVNYNPKTSKLEDNSNYTVMKSRKMPASMSRKSSVPANLGTSSKIRMIDKLQKSLTCLSLSSSLTSSTSSGSNTKNSVNATSVSNCSNSITSNVSSNASDSSCNYCAISANNANTPQNLTKVPSVAMTYDNISSSLNTATTKSAVSLAAKLSETSSSVPAPSQSLASSNANETLKGEDKSELSRQTSSSGSCSDASIVSSTPFFGSIKPPTVSHEKEIQYATLDLPRSDSEEGIGKSENGSKSSSDQSANQTTYTEIDFSKSASASGASTDSNQRR
ncbi:unnamed protein product [Bemisia tabaci]|uniref:Insulin receptor substrate 1 n=1 Tax=Bemisia tabaci TaxID=7038 RepID=A0A9P0A4N6_BEMTA|nr:unnamed protein product [Bemisia tabaci]